LNKIGNKGLQRSANGYYPVNVCPSHGGSTGDICV